MRLATISDKYIIDTSETVNALARASQRLVELADRVDRTQKAYEHLANSSALDMAVEQLQVYQDAARNALTDSERDAAVNKLESQMQRLGIVWRDAATEASSSDHLMTYSLRQLADAGYLAANAFAQASYEKQKGAAAAQMASAQNQFLAQAEREVAKEAKGAERNVSLMNSAMKRVGRTVALMFSARRLLRYMSDAIARAPDEIAQGWTSLTTTIKDGFTGVMVSLMRGLLPTLQRINALLQSPKGQQLLAGLEKLAYAAGEAIGFLLRLIIPLVEWLGDNFEVVVGIACGLLTVYAAKMIAAAVATALAHAKLLLIVGIIMLVIGLISKLTGGVVSATDIISTALGTVYFVVYNVFADIYNVVATVAEFLANVFNDPVAAIVHLFVDLFDVILSILQAAASAIDFIFGSNLAGGLQQFRGNVQQWASDLVGENAIKIERMNKVSLADSVSFFNGFGAGGLSEYTLQEIKSDTGGIAKAVSATEAQLDELIDLAERQYVAQVNLTAQTPIINVNGQNTGNTKEDREALADVLDLILRENIAAGTTQNFSYEFTGG